MTEENITLIARRNRRVQIGPLVGSELLPEEAIEFDATLSEAHTSRSEITDFPVESGPNISDHVRAVPDELSIVGVVSNTPIQFVAGATVENDRAERAWNAARRLQKDGALISIATTLHQYDNMVITSIDTPRNARQGGAVEMAISFREILTAETDIVAIPEPVAKQASTAGKTDKGKVQPEDPPGGADDPEFGTLLQEGWSWVTS